MYARPRGTDAGASIEDDRWYATYFRVAMGFGAEKGKLAWVHLHGADFVGGAAGAGGVVLCDDQGKVVELDAKTGGVLGEMDLGEPVKACVVNVDAQKLSGSSEAKSLAQQLAEVVRTDAPQLVSAQKLLLRELAGVEDDTATKTLVELARNDPRTSPDLVGDARTALGNRRNGATYMEAALGRHYDFLRDVLRPPPVGPMAQALGAMKDKGAAALLASHLLDPADTDDDVRQAAAALAVVAGPDQLPTLREFFGMYRASAADDDIAAAVVSVGQALLTLNDVGVVTAAARDETTVPYAHERLVALLASTPPKPPPTPPDPGRKKGATPRRRGGGPRGRGRSGSRPRRTLRPPCRRRGRTSPSSRTSTTRSSAPRGSGSSSTRRSAGSASTSSSPSPTRRCPAPSPARAPGTSRTPSTSACRRSRPSATAPWPPRRASGTASSSSRRSWAPSASRS